MEKSCYNCKHFKRYFIRARGKFRATSKGVCDLWPRKVALCEKWEEKTDDRAEIQENLAYKMTSLRRELSDFLDLLQADENPIGQEEDGKKPDRPKARKGVVTRSAKPEKEEEIRPAGEREDFRSTVGEGGRENSSAGSG